MLTDSQVQKIVVALQPLYADPEFSAVSADFVVKVTQTPPPPTEVVDEVDVTR